MISWLSIVIFVFVFICLLMMVVYLINIIKTSKYLKESRNIMEAVASQDDSQIEMAVILPCLREQNIIAGSIDYFCSMSLKHVKMHLIISCTKRELTSNQEYGFDCSSADVAREHIKKLKPNPNIDFFVYEANDLDKGDRATQMNEAMDEFLKEHPNIDIVAVFDADSRPDINTFEEVAFRHKKDRDCIFQQPENYLVSANELSKSKCSRLAVANALYQHQWTIINEIPMFLRHYKNNNSFLYMNGHGMFFPLHKYLSIRFPEYEVADGIHVGYRVWVMRYKLTPLALRGYTVAPNKVSKLPQQHKRWYGGAIRLGSAIKWGKKIGAKPKPLSIISGYFMQYRWAFTANLFLVNLALSIVDLCVYKSFIPLISLVSLLFVYSYIYSLISIKMEKRKNHISFFGYLLVPIAILFKSFGPDLYYLQKVFGRKVVYQKCER